MATARMAGASTFTHFWKRTRATFTEVEKCRDGAALRSYREALAHVDPNTKLTAISRNATVAMVHRPRIRITAGGQAIGTASESEERTNFNHMPPSEEKATVGWKKDGQRIILGEHPAAGIPVHPDFSAL